MKCPACQAETNSRGEPFLSYNAVTLHMAAKILHGDRTHRIWIGKYRDVSGWSRKSATWSNMNDLAEEIYDLVEFALDDAFEAETATEESPNDVQTNDPATAPNVTEMGRALNSLLDAIDREEKPYGESKSRRIVRLTFAQIIPRHVAQLMHAIREYRNLVEHETKELSDIDAEAIMAAWKVIHEWASGKGISLRSFSEY